MQFSVILVDGATKSYDGTFKGEGNGGLEITRDDKERADSQARARVLAQD
jgi:hypothetical protein